MRPFDRARRGLALGEGAAFFVLESVESAQRRGARVHAVLSGFGASADAYHWTEPHVDGQVRAMRAALRDAGICETDVAAINAHGTGTHVCDKVEAESIATVFGTASGAPWVYSSKPVHGHALGASGALELAASIASLRAGLVPFTGNLSTADDLPVHLVRGEPAPLDPAAAVLSNSFAFGGRNACLILRAATN